MERSERAHPLIVDTDGGIDGALTLMYALLAPDIALEGVIASPGAVGAAQAADNALRLIRLCDAEGRVPVAAGEGGEPLKPMRDREPAGGRNGLAGALLTPAEQPPLAEPAAAFLVRAANEAPGRASLVIAGAPTQWPAALRLDPSAAGRFARVAVAGGAALAPGDATPVAEASFRAAPEAAAQLLATARPLIAAGLDVSSRLRLRRDDLERIE
ncbi:nucleoside hydrolase, partial [Cohnella zeiphila]|nr:nucleoside hydrolase [Cohnella zeiphila]